MHHRFERSQLRRLFQLDHFYGVIPSTLKIDSVKQSLAAALIVSH